MCECRVARHTPTQVVQNGKEAEIHGRQGYSRGQTEREKTKSGARMDLQACEVAANLDERNGGDSLEMMMLIILIPYSLVVLYCAKLAYLSRRQEQYYETRI